MLRSFPPFCRWSLPDSSEVRFAVSRAKDRYADYSPPPDETIRASCEANGHFATLVQAVAHELIHMRLKRTGEKHWDGHGAPFQRLAKPICKRFGWDVKAFS